MIESIQSIVLNWDIGQIEQIQKVNTPGGKVHSIKLKDGQTYFFKEKNNTGEVEKELQLYNVLSKHSIETSVPLIN